MKAYTIAFAKKLLQRTAPLSGASAAQLIEYGRRPWNENKFSPNEVDEHDDGASSFNLK